MSKLSSVSALCLLLGVCCSCYFFVSTASCQSAIDREDTSKIRIRRLPLQVGEGMVFAPYLSDDGLRLFFVYKNKSKGTLIGKEIFCMAERSSITDTSWGVPKILQLIDNVNHVGAVSFDAKNNAYIAYQSEKAERGDVNIMQVSMSDDGTFTQSSLININSKKWESQPSVSRDGSLLFFASNRGTNSGRDVDIFVSIKDSSGIFGEPINLGSTINRNPYDGTPFIASDNKTLYFVSDLEKRTTMFMSTHIGPTWADWSKPVQLPGEFTLPANVLFPFVPIKGDKIYFTSDQGGKLEIYEVTVPLPNEYFPTLKK